MGGSGSKNFFIKSKLNSYCMQLQDGMTIDGTYVIMWPERKNADDQLWKWDDKTKTIRSCKDDTKCLTINATGFLTVDGYVDKDEQHWAPDVENGLLKNVVDPHKVVIIDAGNRNKEAKLTYVDYSRDLGNAQKWLKVDK